MKGHKRYRSGAWRLVVTAGSDPRTGARRNIYETIHGADNRAGAKAADARLAELIAAVESGEAFAGHAEASRAEQRQVVRVEDLASAWQKAHRPRPARGDGEWLGWSPKTAMTVADNFRSYILPTIGTRPADRVSGLDLDHLYDALYDDRGLSPEVIARCHGQIRAMFNWAIRKKLVACLNPALAADPPVIKPRQLKIPAMSEVGAVQEAATADFAVFVQLAVTVGTRRGTLVALRWRDMDLDRKTATFSRSIAESRDGPVEKGTKADRPYTVSLGSSTVAMLAEHYRRAAERALATGVPFNRDSFVFSDDGGASHWSLAWPSHAWHRYAGRAGVTGLRLHDLRHTAASQMLMGGVPISVVAERLGCTEGNILRNYRHFIPGSDQQAAEFMDRLLCGEAGIGADEAG
jgi:integrase